MDTVQILISFVFSTTAAVEAAVYSVEVSVETRALAREIVSNARKALETIWQTPEICQKIPTIEWGVQRVDDPLDELEGRIEALEEALEEEGEEEFPFSALGLSGEGCPRCGESPSFCRCGYF